MTRDRDPPTGPVDPQTEATRLDAVEEYLAHLRDATPYYAWLDPVIDTVERGFVRVRLPNEDRFQSPELAPDTGINGGIIATLVDAVGMATIISQALEPTALATTHLDVTFHDGVDDAHVVEGTVTDVGTTLATADVRVVPASEVDAADRTVVASARTTARLFGDAD